MNIWLDDYDSIRVVCGATIAYAPEAYERAIEQQRQEILNAPPRRSAMITDWHDER